MKKTLVVFSIAIILGLWMTSCDTSKQQCWLLKAKRGGATIEYYIFASQDYLDSKALELRSKGYEVSYRRNTSYKNEKDCNSNNENLWEDFSGIVIK